MQYDMTKFPISDDGEQLKDENGKPANYHLLVRRALLSDFDGTGQPVKDKFQRFDLYMKIKYARPEIVEITIEEADLITKAALVFPTLVAGQLKHFLEKNGVSVSNATV